MSRISIAVIGTGTWGLKHVSTLASHPDFSLRVACDLDERARAAASAHYVAAGGAGQLATSGELATVLADPRLAAVSIATPAATHVGLATAALAAGKDVLIEKPVAQTLAEVEALAVAAKASPPARIVMAGHLMRYAPAFRQLIASVQVGLIGEVVHCEIERSNNGGVRADEDVIWSLGTHDLSLLAAMLGQAPETIEASNVALDEPTKTLAQVALRLAYANGPTARLFLSRLGGRRVRSWGVRGTGGQLAVVSDEHGALTVLHAAGAPVEGATPAWQPLPAAQAAGDTPLRQQLTHFARAIATRISPLTDLAEAREVVDAALRAQHAARAAYARKWPGSDVAGADAGAAANTTP